MSKAIHTAVIISFFTITSFGQKAEQTLDSFREKFPVEKAYIHLDKEIYSRGETIWFKAYLYHDGAVAVYLNYDPAGTAKQAERPEQFIKYNGYSVTKEFYNPVYLVSATQKDVPDNRTTLYWSPEIYLDDQTKSVRLSFYNNDFSNRFRLIMEGFDAKGRLIHIDKIIEK